MLVIMDMSTGKIEKESVPEFGAFEDEVLNAEGLQPALQLGLQPVVHRDPAPAEAEVIGTAVPSARSALAPTARTAFLFMSVHLSC